MHTLLVSGRYLKIRRVSINVVAAQPFSKQKRVKRRQLVNETHNDQITLECRLVSIIARLSEKWFKIVLVDIHRTTARTQICSFKWNYNLSRDRAVTRKSIDLICAKCVFENYCVVYNRRKKQWRCMMRRVFSVTKSNCI